MSTTILTDEQIDATLESLDCLFWDVSEGATHDFARAIEQAVLQSPEIRELRKNAERIRFIANDCCCFSVWIQEDYTTLYRLEWDYGDEWQPEWYATPKEAIDAAMDQKP